jgi:hypothetical protein
MLDWSTKLVRYPAEFIDRYRAEGTRSHAASPARWP